MLRLVFRKVSGDSAAARDVEDVGRVVYGVVIVVDLAVCGEDLDAGAWVGWPDCSLLEDEVHDHVADLWRKGWKVDFLRD